MTVGMPVPGSPWQNHLATIDAIRDEIPGVRTYDLRFDAPSVGEQFTFLPGQFNMIWLPGLGEVAISISGVTPDGKLRHTIRDAGSVTHALSLMNPGDQVGLRGPFGAGWPMEACEGKDIVIVGGGIGMAPLRPVVHHVLSDRTRFGRLMLLLGARTAQGLLYTEELNELAAAGADSCEVSSGVEHAFCIERTVDRDTPDWQGHVGVVTALLDRLAIPRPEETVLMTCGPEVMMRFTVRTALERGIPREACWVSLERNMNCAVGFCGHCQLGPQFLCKDGPVLPYARVERWLQVEAL